MRWQEVILRIVSNDTEQDDELEALVVLINMVAEEMKESVFHSGFINPHYTYKNLVQTTFILDEDFTIRSYNSAVPSVLGFPPDMLYNKHFQQFTLEGIFTHYGICYSGITS